MFLQNISLLNYKNFSDANFEFDAKINCFVGNNGIGKTNMLDAIYHLSFGKSYFNPIASQNIKHGTDFFVVEGNFMLNEREEKIGSVIRGETMHFDFVCSATAQGIKDLNLQFSTPVIFCVLTDDTLQQAQDRSGGKHGNKGTEAAIAAIKMTALGSV